MRQQTKRWAGAGRLGAYLGAAAGAGAGAVGTTAEAGVVTIDVSAFSGVNGGVSSGTYVAGFSLTPDGGTMDIFNGYGSYWGFYPALGGGLQFATGASFASPTKLLAGQSVDNSLIHTPDECV